MSEDTMRTVVVGFSLALIALVVSPAQARYRHHLYNYSGAQPRYESCNCYFGYIGNREGVCTPVTSCSSTGGHCRASCPPQIGSEWYRTPQSAAITNPDLGPLPRTTNPDLAPSPR
jgi:hypothetical protein